MNNLLFVDWAEHYLKDIQQVRGDSQLWCFFVLDPLDSHTMVPRVLQILNRNNILAISLPSHTSSILQVHDFCIFGPLKKFFFFFMATFL